MSANSPDGPTPVDDALTLLEDRRIVTLAGIETRAFLQRLVTNDVETLGPGEARYAALLTPQGKIVTDFIALGLGEAGGLLLDVPAANAADLIKKLALYRLRAKVTIEDHAADRAVVVFAGSAPPQGLVLAYADPRHPGLWRRGIVDTTRTVPPSSAGAHAAYEAARIAAGVPEGGLDFPYGETFPHDANLDHLHGVDFRKGCYVGQEVVSRVQHRGTARKRIVPVSFEGAAPALGAAIEAEGVAIGTMGSSREGHGLALLRLDRARETAGALTAAGVTLRMTVPAWA